MDISIELERCDKSVVEILPPPPPDPPPPPSKPSSSKSKGKMNRQDDHHQRIRAPKVRAKMVPKKKRDTSFSAECDEVDAYGHRLSAKSKETIMKLKKIDDPFAPEIQEVMDNVCETIQNEGHEMDLAEAALLISGCTKVYSAQVDDAYAYVVAACNRIAGGKMVALPKGRKRKTNEENPEGTEEKKEKLGEEGETGGGEALITVEGEGGVDSEAGKGASGDETGDSGFFDGSLMEGESKENEESGETGIVVEQEGDVQKPADGQEGEKAGEEGKEPTVEEVQQLESAILQEIPTRTTRRQSERLRNILNLEKVNDREYKLKKRKFDDDPPQLISCIEEWNQLLEYQKLNGDVDFDEILPPVLEVQVGRKRKKVVINNNDESEEGCEACHGDDLPCNSGEGVESKEGSEQDKMAATLQLAMSSSSLSGDGSHQYETLDHLPDDVQESFHALIQEMHKLPFDYGLMQQDMFKAYQQKFLQAVSLLSQNSVLVKKREEEKDEKGNPEQSAGTDTQSTCLDASVPLADSQVNDSSQMSETDQTISSINELLSQVRLQATEEYRKGKQSKADAEVPVSQMIATLKKIICSRYKKWHVRADSDKGVFQRIKEFEDKVKAVLIREAEQGLFDVKKYEMEVMDTTFKESQEGDGGDDIFACPLSPMMTPGTSASALLPDGAQSPARPENWPLGSVASRRSSIAGSIDGSSSWIRLYDIFSHMKKIDNSETCRHFYAVLALLSHKNLNVNYDTLFSKESAKLITKLVKTRDESLAQKYPVGAKIMTSRCPDMDEEEVLLAPVFNTETFQQFLQFPENHDGYLSSSGYQSDGQGSGGSSSGAPGPSTSSSSHNHHNCAANTPTKTIQEVLNEFVVDPGEQFPDEYFQTKSNRGRKKY